MIWIIAMVTAAFFIGWLARGLKLEDEAFDDGFSSGYDACVQDVANERIVITRIEKQ